MTYRLSIKGEYHTLFAHSKRIKTEDGTSLLLVTYFDLGNDQSQQSKEQSESPDMDLLTGMPNVSYFSKFGDDFLRKLLKQTLVGVALRAVLFRRQRVGQICLCGCVTTPSHQPPHMILYHR